MHECVAATSPYIITDDFCGTVRRSSTDLLSVYIQRPCLQLYSFAAWLWRQVSKATVTSSDSSTNAGI